MPWKHKEDASIFIYPEALPLALLFQIPPNSNPYHPLQPTASTTSPSFPASPLPNVISVLNFQNSISSPLVAFITFYLALIMYAHDPSKSCWLSLSKDTLPFLHLWTTPTPEPEAVFQWVIARLHYAEPVWGTFFLAFYRRKMLGFPLL